MESADVWPCCSRKAPDTSAPVGSQVCCSVRTETCTVSGGETSGSVGHVPDLQKDIKKEEPEYEEYVCETTTGSVGHITPVCQHTHVKKEEAEEEDYLCDGTSNSVENIVQLNGGFHVKEEESEDEDYLHTMG
ncbi:hypothetical protein PHYPO_G00098600 [Pangasianodon hypophthalmus]|uniref:Uncharacterized protein n=1 Tax=Pangasianodon hypophthalmus TaxID=310915 RepID=A0A5N5LBK1_PANHP|nr:hypothetical protein PHYPO_G00098600 [Pangasianodon hypophthalmus]